MEVCTQKNSSDGEQASEDVLLLILLSCSWRRHQNSSQSNLVVGVDDAVEVAVVAGVEVDGMNKESNVSQFAVVTTTGCGGCCLCWCC